ncbi:MAG TPA: nitrous oxide reductase family maturation protein NosD [Myxococcota bacterium]|jgi:nitrous oxidase accessory protein
MRVGAAASGLVAALALAWSGAAAAASARPPGCRDVPAGVPLQALLDAAAPGSALCLAAGEHRGPLVVPAGVLLWGSRSARVVSSGTGSTIRLSGAGAALEGFTVDGSGARFEHADAAVRIEADGGRVEGLRIEHALFGILAERVKRVRIARNEISGNAAKALGLRGDAIRLWEVRGSDVVGNRVEDARDVVAWYAPGNRFADNVIARGRYGIHFMYSHDCHVEDNRFDANVVGVFVMYSRGVVLERNEIQRSAGAAGMGIGVKEAGAITIRDNRLVNNTVGLYLDTSPLDRRDHNWIDGNLLAGHDRAIVFLGGAARNHIRANTLRGNTLQVALEGGGDALAAEWRGNSFDDYRGYDLDGDGVGDLPYEPRSLAAEWTQHAPALALFRGTPALALVEWLGAAVPLFRPTTLLIDPSPRMRSETRLAD